MERERSGPTPERLTSLYQEVLDGNGTARDALETFFEEPLDTIEHRLPDRSWDLGTFAHGYFDGRQERLTGEMKEAYNQDSARIQEDGRYILPENVPAWAGEGTPIAGRFDVARLTAGVSASQVSPAVESVIEGYEGDDRIAAYRMVGDAAITHRVMIEHDGAPVDDIYR